MVLFFLPILASFSQTNDTSEKQATTSKPGRVSFIATIDIASTTKDGIYLNGYVVNMSYDQIEKLNGKKVRVSGKVTIVKGLNNTPKIYDEKGNELIRGGRNSDTKHIQSPKIEIIQ
ncbi:MAG: hypothetical protein V4685_15715 [Bacteroidota bacterium]